MAPASESSEVTDGQARRDAGDGTASRLKGLATALRRLFNAAAKQRRDWKFIDALLVTITDIIAREGEEALAPRDPARPKRRLRPELRAHIRAVVYSFSDDETSHFLNVGLRQVRHRAQAGDLYFFYVGNKRRYATWQFVDRVGVLPGLCEIVASLPKNWPPETVQEFMLTPAPELASGGANMSPVKWLSTGNDPARIVTLIQQRRGPET